jgi:hypothetical protein
MKRLYIIAALLLSSTLSLPSMASAKVLELGHEASLQMVRMPDSVTGELTLQTCPTCQALRLRADDRTRYQIGKQHVSLVEMKEYLAKNPATYLVVMQRKGTNELSRIVVSAPAFAQ